MGNHIITELDGVEILRCGNCDRVADDYDEHCTGCGTSLKFTFKKEE